MNPVGSGQSGNSRSIQRHHARADFLACLSAALLTALGIGLRLYRLDDQFLLDDEFHAIMAAARYPLEYLATHFLFAANSIPINLYTRLVHDYYGWDEMSLRLPSIIAGIGLLVSAWRFSLAHRKPSEQVLIVGLLAISPVLVYYSRITRPYGLLVWLTFLNSAAAYSLLSNVDRGTTGVRAWRTVSWGITAALSIWIHQVAVFSVAASGMVLAGGWFLSRLNQRPGLKGVEVLVAVGTLTMAGAALLGPPIALTASEFATAYRSRDLYDLQTLWGFAQLACGTGRMLPLLICGMVTAWGISHAWHLDRLWFALLATQVVTHFAALALIRAPDLYAPVVLVRYTAALIPLILITQAMGWADILSMIAERSFRHLGIQPAAATAIGTWLILSAGFVSGPLPTTVTLGGNFMHHAAYTESCLLDRSRAFSNVHRPPLNVTIDSLPEFYRQLSSVTSAADEGLIEYPFPLGHNYCLAYFAQLQHRRPVWGGYVGDNALVDPRHAFIHGPATPGTVARAMKNPAAFHFRRFVNLGNANAIRATRARFLVIHLRPACEISGAEPCQNSTGYAETESAYLIRLATAIESTLGAPIYQDQWVRVFDLAPLQEVPIRNAS